MNSVTPFRVLIVGAAGVFGQRLAEQLVVEPGITIILAGRTTRKLAKLSSKIGGDTECAALDRDRVTPADLRRLDAHLVVDAAGTFQGSGTTLIEAAIAAGCHYVDLSDGRTFVTGIRRFDAAARARNVAVLSGASSTPALSHAALDRLTRGWRQINTMRVAISPGNRAPRGLSVVRAVLTYAGQPVRVFRDGAWTTSPGWGQIRKLFFPGIGVRRTSLCETPDLDLLVERYGPRDAAEFFAGLESCFLHYGLHLSTMPVRWGWVASLAPYARAMHFLASLIRPIGTDRGGMITEATGFDAGGRPSFARWSVAAYNGRGPFVPTLAALILVRKIRDGMLEFRGAQPCAGILSIDDFQADFDRLGIKTEFCHSNCAPNAPYQQPPTLGSSPRGWFSVGKEVLLGSATVVRRDGECRAS